MKSDFAVNKYLHTVAYGWIFINIERKQIFTIAFKHTRLQTPPLLKMSLLFTLLSVLLVENFVFAQEEIQKLIILNSRCP